MCNICDISIINDCIGTCRCVVIIELLPDSTSKLKKKKTIFEIEYTNRFTYFVSIRPLFFMLKIVNSLLTIKNCEFLKFQTSFSKNINKFVGK